MFSSVKIIPELFEFGDSKFSWVGNFLFFANLNIHADRPTLICSIVHYCSVILSKKGRGLTHCPFTTVKLMLTTPRTLYGSY